MKTEPKTNKLITQKPNPAAIITLPVRLAFPALDKPKARSADDANNPAKWTYQSVLLIPPTVPIKTFQQAVVAAMVAKWGKPIALKPGKSPIHECAEKPDVAGYVEGWNYINAHTKRKPGLVDQQAQPCDHSLFYAGCWVRAFVNTYAWEHPVGGKGVSFGLNALQFVRDDERLDGFAGATEVFDAIETEDTVADAEDDELDLDSLGL